MSQDIADYSLFKEQTVTNKVFPKSTSSLNGSRTGVCREEERLNAELNGGIYPKSCPTCGLLGPCVKGHELGSKIGAGSEVIAPHIKELLGSIRSWQDKHDLRPSEVEFALIAAATVFAPTKKT